jgi:hypothetical protein
MAVGIWAWLIVRGAIIQTRDNTALERSVHAGPAPDGFVVKARLVSQGPPGEKRVPNQ